MMSRIPAILARSCTYLCIPNVECTVAMHINPDSRFDYGTSRDILHCVVHTVQCTRRTNDREPERRGWLAARCADSSEQRGPEASRLIESRRSVIAALTAALAAFRRMPAKCAGPISVNHITRSQTAFAHPTHVFVAEVTAAATPQAHSDPDPDPGPRPKRRAVTEVRRRILRPTAPY